LPLRSYHEVHITAASSSPPSAASHPAEPAALTVIALKILITNPSLPSLFFLGYHRPPPMFRNSTWWLLARKTPFHPSGFGGSWDFDALTSFVSIQRQHSILTLFWFGAFYLGSQPPTLCFHDAIARLLGLISAHVWAGKVSQAERAPPSLSP